MTDDEPRQPTQPQGKNKRGRPFDPIEIPVPTRRDFLRDLGKVAPRVEPPASAEPPETDRDEDG